MRRLHLILVFSILFFCTEIYAKALNYNIWIKTNHIKVEFSMVGDKTGRTEVRLPLGLGAGIYPENDDIKIYLNEKLFKTIKKLNPSGDEKDYIISLKHSPLAKINITYNLHYSKYTYPYVYFSKNGFFIEGDHSFVIPKLAQDEEFDIKITLPEYKRSVVSNLGIIKNNTFQTHSNVTKLSQSFFTGGDIDSIEVYPNLKLIFLPSDIKDKEQILQFYAKIMSIHNQFFNEYFPDKEYFILQHVKYMNGGKQTFINGTRINNFVVISIGKEQTCDSELMRIMAHEYLHNWFGFTLKTAPTTYASYAWFIEGFTVYYTDYLNSFNGVISDEEYLESYNNTLKSYFTSPFKNATNQDIASINEHSAIYDIPYLRGRIFAQELDTDIRKVTRNKYNLDLFVKLLMNLAKIDKTIIFDNEFFIKTLQEAIGYDISDLFTKTILNGEDIELKSRSILGKPVTISQVEAPIKDWGFDLLKSEVSGKIFGIKENSDAYIKGLRNGQKLLEYDINNLKMMMSVIDEKGKQKKIEFVGIEQKTMVPQYSFK